MRLKGIEFTMKRTSVVVLSGLFVFVLVVMPVLMIGCGGASKSASTLSIKIIDVDGELKPNILNSAIEQYKIAHAGLVVSTTFEIVSSDILSNVLTAGFAGCDVIITPSLLNSKFEGLSNVFYPVSSAELSIPPSLDNAYKSGSTADQLWSAPLLLDPFVIVARKSNLNDTYKPISWLSLSARAKSMDYAQPYFLIQTGRSLGMADFVACQQFAYGYKNSNFHDTPTDSELSEDDQLAILGQSLANMKRFLFELSDDRISSIPQIKNLGKFISSEAYFTIARYSDYMNLDELSRKRLFAIAIPQAAAPVASCYVTAAGIPIQSGNPALAEDFIKFLITQIDSISKEQNQLPALLPADEKKGIGFYLRETAFVPRVGSVALSDKIVIDAINGEITIRELNDLWDSSFCIPKK
jgi:hypothetical protein